MSLGNFHPLVQKWFSESIGEPTAVQSRGWESIRSGRHTLIAAPTGSGKTLAAFLNALNELFVEGLASPLPDEVRVVYVSPLKALSADIHKNLSEPRAALRRLAHEHAFEAPRITAAVRTGDTTQSERAAMLKTPPHILVTTPESLYLLLTAEKSREMLRSVRTVIVDEIHAVIGTRRGAHLALTLERLQKVAHQRIVRLGLSATQKPIEEVARYLVGAHEVVEGRANCTIVDEGHRRAMDLSLEMPRSPLESVMSHEVWEEYYDRLTELIGQHRTTLIFVNTRRMAERLARHLSDRLGEDAVTAHHGSLSKEKRLDAESRLKEGQLKVLVATASLELGIDIGHVDLVCQIGSPHRIATFLQRVGRSGHTISGTPKGRIFPVSRDDLVECMALLRSVKQGQLDQIVCHDMPLDVLAQQIVAESASGDYSEDELFELIAAAWPYRALQRKDFDSVLAMVSEGFATKRGRRAALVHRDEVNREVRGRRGSRMLAITSGGAIPELADYRVVLEPDDTFVGTLNEDFAIESTAGDIFQLGNTSYQVLKVETGIVRVADAHGAPPSLPFWLGEAPARSDELSRAVSELRADVETKLRPSLEDDLHDSLEATAEWLMHESDAPREAAREVVAYLAEGLRALGALPTQETLVLERFFDESGGMQLVLHAPFGSRVNRAWGLALRKRFCRQFNFELQAAATEDAVLLSLGPQHSFPLADVFRYLHPATAKDVLVQAFLDAPVFQTRWRWNSTISLAIPRNRNGKKVAPQLQRAMADDLMAAVFPDGAACFENIAGDRKLPDHPLVNQAVRDCLEEAMDFDSFANVLTRIHNAEIRCIARDLPEPSALSHEIINAKPYAFLDDAPLEERRTHAVQTRRAGDLGANDLGALDQSAIDRVREEERPDPRDADELHDTLLSVGFLTEGDVKEIDANLFLQLATTRRATVASIGTLNVWFAAERLPELFAIHPDARIDDGVVAPPSRASKEWSSETAIVELVRGRLSIVGPATAASLANSLGVTSSAVDHALVVLEAEGVVLRGRFTTGHRATHEVRPSEERGTKNEELEWCDRRLLARIHRYTLNRLRAEIEPATPAELMRFLFEWQHVTPSARLVGAEGLQEVVRQLDGFEIAAGSWERDVLAARIAHYEPSLLDMLCLTGEVGWARLSPAISGSMSGVEEQSVSRIVGATPIALYLRENGDAWLRLKQRDDLAQLEETVSEGARQILTQLRSRGASFARELAALCSLTEDDCRRCLSELVSAGLVTSDGFAGLRGLLRVPSAKGHAKANFAGRWSLLNASDGDGADEHHDHDVELQARTFLRRYGIVFRRLLTREVNAAPWRELARAYRRMEARGEIRGGRFVVGMSGEQFALPEAVQRMRELRREGLRGEIIVVNAVDPLNLTGIITAEDRVRAVAANRIAWRDGIAVAVLEGEMLHPLVEIAESSAAEISAALTGRKLSVASGFVGRPKPAHLTVH